MSWYPSLAHLKNSVTDLQSSVPDLLLRHVVAAAASARVRLPHRAQISDAHTRCLRISQSATLPVEETTSTSSI
eukprot:7622498-Pyramimonas_sp.AAC.1